MAIPRITIERFLDRILESDVFTGGSHTKPEVSSNLLKYLVVGTLDGINLTEFHILVDLFGIPPARVDAAQSIVRTEAHRLRKRLEQYYAKEGTNDLVRISIPKGKYVAKFEENPSCDAYKEVSLGFQHVNEETPDHVKQALVHFDKAIEQEPSIADAWAGKASAFLTMTLHAYADDPRELFRDAESAAETGRKLDDSCWRAYANLGAIYLFRHEWQQAEIFFNTAHRIASFDIAEIGGYGPYLLASGRKKEARELAQHYLDVGYDSAVLLTRAGLYLYVLREFEDAKDALLKACQRSPNFWRSHLVLSFVYLSLNEPENALMQMGEVEYCARANLWPGMKIMCLEATGNSHAAEAEFAALLKLRQERYVQPMQLALGCLALGDSERAISFLNEACDAHDPFTAWLRLWPFLDPLRTFPAFRELLRKWKFPPV